MPILELITARNVLAFKAVRLAALKDSPSAFGSTFAKESQFSDAEWLKRATLRNSDRTAGYLAMDSGTACGIIAGFLEEHDPTEVHLVSMWVAPTHRRRGIGRLLVEAIITWAIERGARSVHLMVTSNNSSAIEFYRQNGFSMTGNTKPYTNDAALIEYEMSRLVVQLIIDQGL